MTLDDFKAELRARGFDGFEDADLTKYINFAGRDIARLTRPMWEQQVWDIVLTPGQFSVPFTSLDSIKSVDRVYCTTLNFRKKLTPLDESTFFQQWVPLDLAESTRRSEPYAYYVWRSEVWFLPPPQSDRGFDIHGRAKWTDFVAGTDTPVTPTELDELILMGTLMRCHTRAQEPDRAMDAMAQLQALMDTVADIDDTTMFEEPERTEPDRSWR
jgi:hypothetical protein